MMKRVALTLLILALPTPCLAKYSGGSGAPDDPYQIANVADLLAMAANTGDYNKCFILTADIDLDPNLPGGQVFTTAVIAFDKNKTNWDFDGNAFSGKFDGADYKILNLTIDTNGSENDYLGLFGEINGGEVKNLWLMNVSVTGNVNAMFSSKYISGLLGYNNGSMSNCYLTGTASGFESIGGLVGYNHGNISNCYSAGTVTGIYWLGGVAGFNDGNISNCHSTSTVDGPDVVGGLVGYNYGTIRNCYSTGDIINKMSYSNLLGGLVGGNSGGIISDCYSESTITSLGFSAYSGGLVGENSEGVIINCHSIGNVTSGSDSRELGGLAGWNYYGIISNCYSKGAVSSGGNSYYLAGLVGHNSYGNIDNCYSTGAVAGHTCLGGLVGENWEGDISNCYSTGFVDGEILLGGLVGDFNSGNIDGCYFLITAGPDNGYGVPLTDEQMKQQSSFIGWDFVGETKNGYKDYWRLCNEGLQYPKLSWQYTLGDFVCPDGVDVFDLMVFCDRWIVGFVFDKMPLGGDGIVNFSDYAVFADQWASNPDIESLGAFANEWLGSSSRADLWPSPNGDKLVNFSDFAVLANHWLEGL